MKAFKVVTAWNLTSARYGGVQYQLGQFVDAPEGTRLFVFSNIEAARDFRGTNEVIYECEVKGNTKFVPCERSYDIKKYWEIFCKLKKSRKGIHKEAFKGIHLSPDFEEGVCLLVKSVKLLRKV